ncbi:hypothetical protein [Psychroflexus sp. MES1-P1E]|uniref:hypothetical protein n=1 Tax=Psychroflexus sp. MES1-P1E TaxID=2058320 RepID=UPI000C7D7E55|nr:hypothetical protein [Psychroflexus sp. MES1-P1E]PKG42634.1 hypothetical protein CXF67_09230 [Psychroflexus sp. MES1-P1E]
MITRSGKKWYKENNQFLLTISGLFVVLTLANTQFNTSVQGKDMFIMTLILICSFPLFILFINRQADRHREYHRLRMNFIFNKMSEDTYLLKILKPEILDIIKKEYTGNVNEYSYDMIADDIYKKYRSDLEKPFNRYQNEYNLELIKLKLSTLTNKYEWEYMGKIRAWFDFILFDVGRYVLLISWVIYFFSG